ncbi:MAG: translation elongation factor G, partial [Ruminococcaceae bacterium]|nr:translation elongation factor G [Oscillospiraceae bacterium]
EVQLLLEPLPRGSGLRFGADMGENHLDINWQRLVLTHLHEKQHIGVLTGSPITDMRITLIAGRAHNKHTEGGDFRQATWRAVRQGLRMAESVLLEPWYDFRLEVPAECVGHAMTDITQMGGRFETPDGDGETAILTGSAPVAAMRGYHRELVSYSKGKGRLTCILRGYEECTDPEKAIADCHYDADRDVENTADSVFCAHGAGFVVPWQEVPAHAHVDSGMELESDQPDSASERAERYMKAVATDDELMAIFERTYGPIKRKVYSEPKVKHAVPQRFVRAPRSYMGKEYLLVDGYNIIFAWDDLRELSKKSLDLAREALITRLCNYQGFRRCEVIVVFDAYRVKGNRGELEKVSGVSVVYTKEAETADSYIEKTSHELAKNNRVRVATSDADEQMIILGNGAVRLSASMLLGEVADVERQIRELID